VNLLSYLKMRNLLIFTIIFSLGCENTKDKMQISDKISKNNIWTLINKQSDFLRLIPISFNNKYEKNKSILIKYLGDTSTFFRHRIGQNKYIRLWTVGVPNYIGAMGWWGNDLYFIINFKNEILMDSVYPTLDSVRVIYKNMLINNQVEEFPQIYFQTDCNSSQEFRIQFFDSLAIGYEDFLQIKSNLIFSKDLWSLTKAQQEELIKQFPFNFLFDDYGIYTFSRLKIPN
jgi:hypothetical protein